MAIAQKNKVDSLTAAYKKTKQDTTLIKLLLEKATAVYLTTNTDSGMFCLQKSLVLSRKIHFKKGEVESLASIATYLSTRGDLPGSMQTTFDVLPKAIEINDTRVIIQCYNNLGLLYSTLKDHKKSLNYELKEMKLAEKAHMVNLALIAYNNLARNYLDINNLDSASYYNQKAYTITLKTHMDKNIGYLIRNFGIIQYKKGNYPQAIDYYKKSFQSKSAINNHYLLSEDYRRIAEVYNKINNTDSCIYYSKKAFEEAKLNKNPELVISSAALLANAFGSINNFKEAYNYEQIMNGTKDSLFSQQKTLQIQTLAFNQEQQKREIESAKIAYQTK